MTETTIRVAILEGDVLQRGSEELLDRWQRGSGALLWIDVQNPAHESIEPLLEQRFGFHELAAEDSVSAETLPKYDRFSSYDFFVFRAVDIDLESHDCQTHKLAAFIGADFLVTLHRDTHGAVSNVHDRLPHDRRLLSNGPDFLLYVIVDQMVDGHFPLLERIDERIDLLQEDIFAGADQSQLDELLRLKRDLNVMRRQIYPQRDLLNQISRGDAQFVQREHLIYYRDIYDHMFRIGETIDVQRDSMASTMDAYLSIIANRTNEVMRMLTVFSSIMLPLSLIAGIYGMNFEHMRELHWRYGYHFAIALMAITAAVMLVFFYRKGWIGRSRRDRSGRSAMSNER